MPKIKVKNIPAATGGRICDEMHFCSECPFHLEERFVIDEDTDTGCMVDSRYDPKETIVELPNEYFPTNREWIESLSNEDLAAFFTYGVDFSDGTYVNIRMISASFTASELGVKEWLSQPCKYLMEEK